MKKEQKQEWDANTLGIPYYITPPLTAWIVYDSRSCACVYSGVA